MGETGEVPPPGGPLPRGPGLSLEKAQTKEHQGLRPLDPGGEGRRFLPSRSPSLGCGNGKGSCSGGVSGLRPSQRQAPKASRPPIGRLAPIARTLWGQRRAQAGYRFFSFGFLSPESLLVFVLQSMPPVCHRAYGRIHRPCKIRPSAERTTTCKGMAFSLPATACWTARWMPPQQGTSIRTTVTLRMSLASMSWVSLSR